MVEYDTLILSFTSIIYEALPFVVLGVVIAGIFEEFVPQQLITRVFAFEKDSSPLTPYHIGTIMLGGVLGMVFPMCECGIIAIIRRLLRKGVPLSVCVTYMLAGPIINVVVLMSTYVAFNPPEKQDWVLGGPMAVVLLRAGLGFVIAVITGVIVALQYQRHGNSLVRGGLIVPRKSDDDSANVEKASLLRKLGNIAEVALHDFIDIMAFLILGATLAAVGRLTLAGSQFEEIISTHPALAILGMMGIAVLFCLCSEADAFVAANFPMTWAPAAKLSFMVLGPMFDLKLLLMYTRIFRRRLIVTIILSVVVQVFVYTMAVHYLLEGHGFSESYLRLKR